ncbi:MAG: hypothetical protein OXG92_15455 [Chloroflexi bacterium]|nr:hypothetical protein [Chloroflexota bacterium]MXX84735.1 hypothetical protein [Chloroflexota bacterium]MYA93695.1 hypothetical protein [Chloroflexota bacterium]MYC56250.1 hypothetical protein [Chloroflexota bacterium]MYD38928.1 hypothetical protein [Chloroflexota bacterium]
MVAVVASGLAYVILGATDEAEDSPRRLLSFSGALPSLETTFYTDLAQMLPMRTGDDARQPALAMLAYDSKRMLLINCQPKRDDAGFTEHHVFVPQGYAPDASQLEDWLTHLPKAPTDLDMTVMTMSTPGFVVPTASSRSLRLAWLLEKLADDRLAEALRLLGVLIEDGNLVFSGYPRDFRARLELVAGLQALLPSAIAARISFATVAPVACQQAPQLTFADTDNPGESHVQWGAPLAVEAPAAHPYLDLLRSLWQGDVGALAEELQQMDSFVDDMGSSLAAALAAATERYRLDKHVAAGADVETAAVLAAVDSGAPPVGELRGFYFARLLQIALHKRDRAAGRRVAEEMAGDPQLEAQLLRQLDAMLDNQPDAVYVFIRNRLIDLGLEPGWITRLQTAARASLDVAIQAGDGGTLASWLELLTREPPSYELSGTLREGILQARARAYADGDLSLQLIMLAARRFPDIADDLCRDERLLAPLPEPRRQALQSPSAAHLATLADNDAGTLLLALRRGLGSSDAEEPLVGLAAARRLWTFYAADERINLPAEYQPGALIQVLMTQSSQLLTDDALDFLFARLLAGDDLELTTKAAEHLAGRELLFPRLTRTLERAAPPLEELIAIMAAVASIKSAPPQALADAYFSLLDQVRWDTQAQRMVEALARLLAKHPEATVPEHRLWRLYESCQATRQESGCRVAVGMLLREYGEKEDPAALVNGIARLCRQVDWSKNLQELVKAWWREYAQSLTLAQLQRLERELDAQRGIEPQKQILKTALAMRRWLQSRDASEFSAAIQTAFTVVERLADAFDSPPAEIDTHTIHSEVDALSQALTNEQRHILATNLRNLAQRITQMAENRSKPSLMRSDDSIDRQLMHGQAQPQGAVDMMKWVAGYLDGAHQPVGE